MPEIRQETLTKNTDRIARLKNGASRPNIARAAHTRPARRRADIPDDGAGQAPADRIYPVSIRHSSLLWMGTAALLLAAVFPWPYGYYVLLRLTVTLVSGWVAFQCWKQDKSISGWVAAFGAVALLYNPVLPIFLTKALWVPINIATAALFIWHYRMLKEQIEDADRINKQQVGR